MVSLIYGPHLCECIHVQVSGPHSSLLQLFLKIMRLSEIFCVIASQNKNIRFWTAGPSSQFPGFPRYKIHFPQYPTNVIWHWVRSGCAQTCMKSPFQRASDIIGFIMDQSRSPKGVSWRLLAQVRRPPECCCALSYVQVMLILQVTGVHP